MSILEQQVAKLQKEIVPQSSFAEEYEKFNAEYEKLIVQGLTKRRESQMPSLLDKRMSIYNYKP